MSRLHICNTFFESELTSQTPRSLTSWLRSHPIVLQLQFLPLLYAGPDDKIAVSDMPLRPDPRLCLIDTPPTHLPIIHWGPSLSIAAWAKKHNIAYTIPDWPLVQKLNSKVFSFLESPKLPGAQLLQTSEELESWIKTIGGPSVLKTPFGTAGKGHILNLLDVKQLYKWPLIGEPWVERVQDFSTQWEDGKLVGVTVFENEPNGTYKATLAGSVEPWALKKHLEVATPLISKLWDMGYKGNVGVDAFIYLWKGEKQVHPVVEINGRKTMSWVGLSKPIQYVRAKTGLLPSELMANGKLVSFTRNITYI